VGTQQALLGYMFRQAAPTSRVLAFSVGMQFVTTFANAAVGGLAIWLTLRRLPGRARPAGADSGVAPSG